MDHKIIEFVGGPLDEEKRLCKMLNSRWKLRPIDCLDIMSLVQRLSKTFGMLKSGRLVSMADLRHLMSFRKEYPETYLELHNLVCDDCGQKFMATCTMCRRLTYVCTSRAKESAIWSEPNAAMNPSTLEHVWNQLRDGEVPGQLSMEILLVSFDSDPQGYMDAVRAFCKKCHGRCSPCLHPIHHTKTELENGENLSKAKESTRLAEKTKKATPLSRTMSDDEVSALAARVGECRLPQHVTMRDGSVRLNPETKAGLYYMEGDYQ